MSHSHHLDNFVVDHFSRLIIIIRRAKRQRFVSGQRFHKTRSQRDFERSFFVEVDRVDVGVGAEKNARNFLMRLAMLSRLVVESQLEHFMKRRCSCDVDHVWVGTGVEQFLHKEDISGRRGNVQRRRAGARVVVDLDDVVRFALALGGFLLGQEQIQNVDVAVDDGKEERRAIVLVDAARIRAVREQKANEVRLATLACDVERRDADRGRAVGRRAKVEEDLDDFLEAAGDGGVERGRAGAGADGGVGAAVDEEKDDVELAEGGGEVERRFAVFVGAVDDRRAVHGTHARLI